MFVYFFYDYLLLLIILNGNDAIIKTIYFYLSAKQQSTKLLYKVIYQLKIQNKTTLLRK